MGFSIITKKSGSRNSGKGYHRLKSIENFSNYVHKDSMRYSVNSNSDVNVNANIPIQNTYNKRFSEQSYNTVSDISQAETYCSTITSSTTTTSTEYSYNNNYNYNNNIMYGGVVENPDVQNDKKKKKKHRKRKTLSKILQSFSLNDQLKQSMKCPDWEYYCNNKNAFNTY